MNLTDSSDRCVFSPSLHFEQFIGVLGENTTHRRRWRRRSSLRRAGQCEFFFGHFARNAGKQIRGQVAFARVGDHGENVGTRWAGFREFESRRNDTSTTHARRDTLFLCQFQGRVDRILAIDMMNFFNVIACLGNELGNEIRRLPY